MSTGTYDNLNVVRRITELLVDFTKEFGHMPDLIEIDARTEEYFSLLDADDLSPWGRESLPDGPRVLETLMGIPVKWGADTFRLTSENGGEIKKDSV